MLLTILYFFQIQSTNVKKIPKIKHRNDIQNTQWAEINCRSDPITSEIWWCWFRWRPFCRWSTACCRSRAPRHLPRECWARSRVRAPCCSECKLKRRRQIFLLSSVVQHPWKYISFTFISYINQCFSKKYEKFIHFKHWSQEYYIVSTLMLYSH